MRRRDTGGPGRGELIHSASPGQMSRLFARLGTWIESAVRDGRATILPVGSAEESADAARSEGAEPELGDTAGVADTETYPIELGEPCYLFTGRAREYTAISGTKFLYLEMQPGYNWNLTENRPDGSVGWIQRPCIEHAYSRKTAQDYLTNRYNEGATGNEPDMKVMIAAFNHLPGLFPPADDKPDWR